MPQRRKQNEFSPQRFQNGEVHDWYRIIHGYSDHLVAGLIQQFKLSSKHRVLDPFCGAGTTLVECRKFSIQAVGIDANPSSCFAARVKTRWRVDSARLTSLLPKVARNYVAELRKPSNLKSDTTYRYLNDSGMIDRGWISDQRLQKAVAIKKAIKRLKIAALYKDVLYLALLSEVVNSASNVRFGPELYCGKPRQNVNVLNGFAKRVKAIGEDLEKVHDMPDAQTDVIGGDARQCSELLRKRGYRRFHAVICSPPYPAEHDYTRNSRLELAFLEAVSDRTTLQKIKKGMIRSHTKGIYGGDNDGDFVSASRTLRAISAQITKRAKSKSHGFARLYPKVLVEYFGGMMRHFREVIKILAPGSYCAYVVGDQSSYLRVYVPTAQILGKLARDAGFKQIRITRWRSRWSTTTAKKIDENILVMRKPF